MSGVTLKAKLQTTERKIKEVRRSQGDFSLRVGPHQAKNPTYLSAHREGQMIEASPSLAPLASECNFEPLLSAEEAALLLGCHPRTLLRKAREGNVPSVRVFDKVRFRSSALNDWLDSQGYNQIAIRVA